MFNVQDQRKNAFMLEGLLARQGYDWWWHSFTGVHHTTGQEKAFFIEYFLCNPGSGGEAPVFGQLPENKEKGIRPSYMMVKAGCWGEKPMQLHRFFGWDQVTVLPGAPFQLEADDCYADEYSLKGSVGISEEETKAHPEWMCDSGYMSWRLTIDKQVAFNVGYGTSKPLREAEAFEMYWHAEGMKSQFTGTVICNGEVYDILPERSYGYADKNWGRDFTSPWVWLSSNCLKSRITGKMLEDSVFDIGGGRPKIYFKELENKLLGAFWYEGEEFEYNFSKFLHQNGTRFHCEETEDEIHWHVTQENENSVMDTKVRCKKKDMLLVNYEAPDGSKKHTRLWNGGNGVGVIRLYNKTRHGLELLDEIEATHIGCEYGAYQE
ncbi:MAG: tocopherol cyclase family protein [Lachnospiraceae bacterium]|nr:tocopherol cyclase family protein [Lachnospiraceae bacterium]